MGKMPSVVPGRTNLVGWAGAVEADVMAWLKKTPLTNDAWSADMDVLSFVPF